jgi:DNA segregation ATPase FtsK/SpoIIIE, S-DNA-T family
MLFLFPGTSQLLRGQGTYLSDDEITRVVDFVATDAPQFASELINLKTKEELESAGTGGFKNRDELYEAATDIVVRERRGSVSLLQRALGIGYGRAARLIDFMAEDGIVGEYNGSQAREVLITLEQWEAMSEAEVEVAAATGATTSPGSARSTASEYRGGSLSASAAGDGPARSDDKARSTMGVSPRRSNKILPDPEEPSELEDETDELEDGVYDDEDLEEEEWEDDEEQFDEEEDEEQLEDDEADEYEGEEEWEEDAQEEQFEEEDSAEDEWEEEEELENHKSV